MYTRKVNSLDIGYRVIFILMVVFFFAACENNPAGGPPAVVPPTVPPVVADPTFNTGSADTNVLATASLTISTTTDGATIYYTTDGTDPSITTEGNTRMEYMNPLPFHTLGTGEKTIRAIAVRDGYAASGIVGETFTIRLAGTVTTPTFTTGSEDTNVLAAASLTISTTTDGATIYYTTDGTDPSITTEGNTRMEYMDPLPFQTIGTGEQTIRAIAVRDGYTDSGIVEETFTISLHGTIPTPTFTTGSVDTNVLATASLTIGTTIEGATIYYTTDGTDPSITTEGNTRMEYMNPLPFHTIGTGEKIIRAIAVRDGYTDSGIVGETFTISLAGLVPTPTFTTRSADMNVLTTDSLTISISPSASDATIYYTTNGDNPGLPASERTRYEGAVSFGASSLGVGDHTVMAVAERPGYTTSAPGSMSFTVLRDVDRDNNGLIEIDNLDMLNHIRYNLAGTSYDDEMGDGGLDGGDIGSSVGAPTSRPPNCVDRTTTTNLCGYELTRNLDFAIPAHYASGSVNNAWRPTNTSGTVLIDSNIDMAMNAGFPGFGSNSGETYGLTAIFDGKGYTINNLYMHASTEITNIGLFRVVRSSGIIRNIGLTGINIYGTSANDRIGGLAGYNAGRIIGSYATGKVDAKGGSNDVGGLVGENNNAAIIASHSDVRVLSGTGTGTDEYVGGLVGYNGNTSTITASYSRGKVRNEGGGHVGGLVGGNVVGGTTTSPETPIIRASYSTGNVTADTATNALTKNFGGLVGTNSGIIRASYSTGTVNAGAGGFGRLGGLSGYNTGTISASYSTGAVTGGGGAVSTGGLVGGFTGTSMITQSYAFGTVSPGGNSGDLPHNGSPPTGVTTASGLTAMNSATDAADRWSTTFWNFGNNNENPALVYADYDGGGSAHACSDYPSTIPGTTTTIVCGRTTGNTLVGGAANQGR